MPYNCQFSLRYSENFVSRNASKFRKWKFLCRTETGVKERFFIFLMYLCNFRRYGGKIGRKLMFVLYAEINQLLVRLVSWHIFNKNVLLWKMSLIFSVYMRVFWNEIIIMFQINFLETNSVSLSTTIMVNLSSLDFVQLINSWKIFIC